MNFQSNFYVFFIYLDCTFILLYHPCRVSSCNAVGRDGFRHHAACGDDSSVTNRHTFQDDAASPYETVAADSHRCAAAVLLICYLIVSAVLIVQRVKVGGIYLHAPAQQGMTSYCNVSSHGAQCGLAHPHIVRYTDMTSVCSHQRASRRKSNAVIRIAVVHPQVSAYHYPALFLPVYHDNRNTVGAHAPAYHAVAAHNDLRGYMA